MKDLWFRGSKCVFAVMFVVLGSCVFAQAQWVTMSGSAPMPVNAFFGGNDAGGLQLPLCQAVFEGTTHPGKVFEKACIITYGGHEVYVRDRYSVYVGRVRWQQGPGTQMGNLTAIETGTEGGVPRYLCQAQFVSEGKYIGTYPGKVVDGKCNIGWYSKEFQVANYKVGFDATPLEPVWFRAKIYRIVSIKTGKGVDITGASTANGAVLQQWSDTHVGQQQWQIKWKGAGYYQIRSFLTGKCLKAGADDKARSWAPVTMWDCADSNDQMWSITNGDTPVQQFIVSKSNKKKLTLEQGYSDDGANILLWEHNGAPFQLWRFETVSTPATLEFECRQSLDGQVALNLAGDKRWLPGIGDNLCAGTRNPQGTIACFSAQIAKGVGLSPAIAACKAKV